MNIIPTVKLKKLKVGRFVVTAVVVTFCQLLRELGESDYVASLEDPPASDSAVLGLLTPSQG